MNLSGNSDSHSHWTFSLSVGLLIGLDQAAVILLVQQKSVSRDWPTHFPVVLTRFTKDIDRSVSKIMFLHLLKQPSNHPTIQPPALTRYHGTINKYLVRGIYPGCYHELHYIYDLVIRIGALSRDFIY